MTTDEWVRRLNKLAYEIDELAASLHPSAWREQLGLLWQKYEQLAKVVPDDKPPTKSNQSKE